MTVRLRAHHLLCLLTYVGRGYSPAFVAGYDRIVARLDAGEGAVLVAGPDDICAPMLGAGHHCHEPRIAARDAAALAALAGLSGGALSLGATFPLSRDEVARLRAAFATGAIRAACAGCQWTGLCDQVAARGFSGTRLAGADLVTPPRALGTPD
ncbi:DUF1284 domain-containing protein [Ancylobacter lacus]|uniref:DUF1284 domain-containing protein n=1 Tax=Ancylobacter lacus TaxID=2579970 RepID=UPI001BCF6C5B|nr:DUF1284 domain-containing protein [Ancylobacter lacus]MBS7538728.1 DUF1284 domain-containing protein [Ancylobacter lacus]